METTATLRVAYATPQTEFFTAEPYKFLADSNTGGGIGGGAGEGGDDGEITGAKGFGLDNDWGKLRGLNPDESWGDLWDY